VWHVSVPRSHGRAPPFGRGRGGSHIGGGDVQRCGGAVGVHKKEET